MSIPDSPVSGCTVTTSHFDSLMQLRSPVHCEAVAPVQYVLMAVSAVLHEVATQPSQSPSPVATPGNEPAPDSPPLPWTPPDPAPPAPAPPELAPPEPAPPEPGAPPAACGPQVFGQQ